MEHCSGLRRLLPKYHRFQCSIKEICGSLIVCKHAVSFLVMILLIIQELMQIYLPWCYWKDAWKVIEHRSACHWKKPWGSDFLTSFIALPQEWVLCGFLLLKPFELNYFHEVSVVMTACRYDWSWFVKCAQLIQKLEQISVFLYLRCKLVLQTRAFGIAVAQDLSISIQALKCFGMTRFLCNQNKNFEAIPKVSLQQYNF